MLYDLSDANSRRELTMERSFRPEILDAPSLPEHMVAVCYDGLARIHKFLGNERAILDALRRDPRPVERVLDIGCAHGALLRQARRELGVDVIGVDLRPPKESDVPIIEADARSEELPHADVAFAVCLIHHLSESDLIDLIRNVGRSCRRFILLDLVRHRMPLFLFRWFVCPFVNHVVGADGCQSIRRAFTTGELSAIVKRALDGTGATFDHTVTPLYTRQMVDIHYA